MHRVRQNLLSYLTKELQKKICISEFMWYAYKIEYYSARKNEILPLATTWIDLEQCFEVIYLIFFLN